MLLDTSKTARNCDDVAEPVPKLRAIAKECLADVDGDWKRAADLMRERVTKDRAMFEELMMPMVDAAIWNHIRLASAEGRRGGLRSSQDNVRGLYSVARTVERGLLDTFRLQGGMKLGDATRGTLAVEIAVRRRNADGNTRAATFLAAISDKVPASKCVRDVLSNEQVNKLYGKHGLGGSSNVNR